MGMGAILDSRCSISLGKNEGRWEEGLRNRLDWNEHTSRWPIWSFERGTFLEIRRAGSRGRMSTGKKEAVKGYGEPCKCYEEKSCVESCFRLYVDILE